MPQSIIEYLREQVIEDLFKLKTVNKCWSVWVHSINEHIVRPTPTNIVNLGDYLSDVFRLTGGNERSQSDVSSGGTAWEALVCWYMNLCLIGTRAVVVKKQSMIPYPIREAITVKYGSFPSNTESDLVAIIFPNKQVYFQNDKFSIQVRNDDGEFISPLTNRNKFNYNKIIDTLVSNDFSEIEIGIIQCKTNWNDNAQIPMLWDMIYTSARQDRISNQITVGSSLYSIKDIKKFTYSFVTVPTSKIEGINSNSTCVKRVQNLSGKNYWGMSSLASVALSISEIFGNNFRGCYDGGLRKSLTLEIPKLRTTYSYFMV